MILSYLLIFIAVLIVIGLNILIYHIIRIRALRKYIIPKLNKKGLIFIDYKFPGFLSNGDFKVTTKNKKGMSPIYLYIFYKDGNEIKRITAQIDAPLWFIDKVSYSTEL